MNNCEVCLKICRVIQSFLRVNSCFKCLFIYFEDRPRGTEHKNSIIKNNKIT